MKLNHVTFGGVVYKITSKNINGRPMTEIRMRQTRAKGNPKTRGDNPELHTDWMTVTCWGTSAEVAERLSRDDFIVVEGRLRHEEWADRETGEKRSKVTITATYIHLLPRERATQGASGIGATGDNTPF